MTKLLETDAKSDVFIAIAFNSSGMYHGIYGVYDSTQKAEARLLEIREANPRFTNWFWDEDQKIWKGQCGIEWLYLQVYMEKLQ